MGPAFLCFLAIALLKITDSEIYAWRIACIFQSLFIALLLVAISISERNLSETQRSQINRPIFRTVVVVFSLVSLVLFLTGAGIFQLPPFTTFYIGLVMILLVGVYQFFRAVLEGLYGT
jgi:hypothetical protein